MYTNFILKPEESHVIVSDYKGDGFLLNREREGYRLSLSPDCTICLVRKEINKKEEILLNENDLTVEQLENARKVFSNDHYMRRKRIQNKFDDLIEDKLIEEKRNNKKNKYESKISNTHKV